MHDDLSVGWAELDVVLGEDVFQQRMLGHGEGVELIDVDQGKAREGHADVVVVLHRQAVVVIVVEFRRKDDFGERRLASALPSDDERHDGIAVAAVLAQPVGYHRKHPHVEVVGPMGILGMYATCEFADAVFAVPSGQVVEIVGHGVVLRDERGIHVAAQVFVP